MQTTKFRLYVYTAYRGFAWQGVERDVKMCRDLENILDSTGVRKALPDGNGEPSSRNTLGGMLHGTLSGERGVSVWRVHVRRAGDAQYRDSCYIALLFLPLRCIDVSQVDFAKLWDAPLLRAPKSGDVSELSVDLASPEWPCIGNLDVSGGPPPGDGRIPDRFLRGEDPGVAFSLAEVSGEFRSRRRIFGNCVANAFPGGASGEPRFSLRYAPFPAVADAESLKPSLSFVPSDHKSASDMAVKADKASVSLSGFAASSPEPELVAYSHAFSDLVADFKSRVRESLAPPPQRVPDVAESHLPLREPVPALGGYSGKTTPEPRRPVPPVDSAWHQMPGGGAENARPGMETVRPVASPCSRSPERPSPKSDWLAMVAIALAAAAIAVAASMLLFSRFQPNNHDPENGSRELNSLKSRCAELDWNNSALQRKNDALVRDKAVLANDVVAWKNRYYAASNEVERLSAKLSEMEKRDDGSPPGGRSGEGVVDGAPVRDEIRDRIPGSDGG